MSVINNAHPGSHIPTLCLIDRILNRSLLNKKDEYISVEDILNNYSPEQLFRSDDIVEGEYKINTNPQGKLKESIRFWSAFPLWDVSDEGIRSKSALNNENDFPSRLLNSIFYKQHNVLEGTQIEPLIVALCAMLAIDKSVLLGSMSVSSSSVAQLISSYLPKYKDGDTTRLSINSSDASGLLAYANFLGFTETLENKIYSVDPTRAIKSVLYDLYDKNEISISIETFIVRLNKLIPLFDGSEYRNTVEDLMFVNQTNKVKFEKRNNRQISASLGFALYRLSVEGLIYLDVKSDADYRKRFELPSVGIIEVSDIRLTENKL